MINLVRTSNMTIKSIQLQKCAQNNALLMMNQLATCQKYSTVKFELIMISHTATISNTLILCNTSPRPDAAEHSSLPSQQDQEDKSKDSSQAPNVCTVSQ